MIDEFWLISRNLKACRQHWQSILFLEDDLKFNHSMASVLFCY